MTHAYTEEQLVEPPAIGLFAELDRQSRRTCDLLPPRLRSGQTGVEAGPGNRGLIMFTQMAMFTET